VIFRESGREARRRGEDIFRADLVIFSFSTALSFPKIAAGLFT